MPMFFRAPPNPDRLVALEMGHHDEAVGVDDLFGDAHFIEYLARNRHLDSA